jgi:hypothetical protein
MEYKTKKGKKVNIPDDEIDTLVDKLDLSIAEACELWLEDNALQVNEEQEELDKKAKASRITATIHEAKATKERKERKVVRKEDTTKENIIKALAERLEELATEVKIEKVGKLITFKLGEDSFKLDLIRQRKPKAKG